MFEQILNLKNKTALVVGAGGLGQPIALALLENGADLILASPHSSPSEELFQAAKALGKTITVLPVDLLSEESIVRMVQAAKEVTGRIDILVNAAGINIHEPAEAYSADSFDRVMNINLRGVYLTCREVGKVMIAQNYGRILSVSSVKSFIGTDANYTAYCASKGALNMYTKQLACEWGRHGITVNAIAPTFTRTPINAFQLDDPEFYGALVRRIPLGRICSDYDIGCAAAFLCSDAAAFISGQILALDGGLTAKQ